MPFHSSAKGSYKDDANRRLAGRVGRVVAWQRADDLFITLHQLSLKHFPPYERFELGGQLRRAAFSVPANIVEGFARRHRRDRLHVLNISESSLAEAGYCLHVAKRLGYIPQALFDELEKQVRGVAAPLVGLMRSLDGDSESNRR